MMADRHARGGRRDRGLAHRRLPARARGAGRAEGPPPPQGRRGGVARTSWRAAAERPPRPGSRRAYASERLQDQRHGGRVLSGNGTRRRLCGPRRATAPRRARAPQSSPARSALSCHPPEERSCCGGTRAFHESAIVARASLALVSRDKEQLLDWPEQAPKTDTVGNTPPWKRRRIGRSGDLAVADGPG